MKRLSGLVLPMFSARREGDFGIGDIESLRLCGHWAKTAGFGLVQILPVSELSGAETSPYGARTAFAVDPVYIALDKVPELPEGPEAVLSDEERQELSGARKSPRVRYEVVRRLKRKVLRVAWQRFLQAQPRPVAGDRSAAFRAFRAAESAWLDDYALFVSLWHEKNTGWEQWPERDRDPQLLDLARTRLAESIDEQCYYQWLALSQWDEARQDLAKADMKLMGDVPFALGNESVDVWADPLEFRRELSLGCPPDAFAADGQDWGLPVYDIAKMREQGFVFFKRRTEHMARLVDCFRLDHVVGYFRTWYWTRSPGSKPVGQFDVQGEPAQADRGRELLVAMGSSAPKDALIAEDLGVIPPFVRDTLRDLGIPGYRIVPWERGAHEIISDPRSFPACSVAAYSTHDTAPISSWWDSFSHQDKERLASLAGFDVHANVGERALPLLRLLSESPAELVLVQPQEVLDEPHRVNLPGSVSDDNWTYRLPLTAEALMNDAFATSRARDVAQVFQATGRL
ncbi:MAG: 4-alpha-glucanotransferase [Polyangiaceae bacterium]